MNSNAYMKNVPLNIHISDALYTGLNSNIIGETDSHSMLKRNKVNILFEYLNL